MDAKLMAELESDDNFRTLAKPRMNEFRQMNENHHGAIFDKAMEIIPEFRAIYEKDEDEAFNLVMAIHEAIHAPRTLH